MRQEDIKTLIERYTSQRTELDRRFESSIGANVPSAGRLFIEICRDLDTASFGISWWGTVPVEERILISDYLYQCAEGIEKNLAEAKLHYLEWLHARDRQNSQIADGIKVDQNGELYFKPPTSNAPIDDLPTKLEGLHLCGFFRAIGSSLDCLGAVIIGVMGLDTSLRRSSINIAEKVLSNVKTTGDPGLQLQLDFRVFFGEIKKSSGPEDWLEWADQYRNMFVHRGRRLTHNQVQPREPPLYDSAGQWIPRAISTLHLAKYPDKSDAEAFIRLDMILSEDAEETLSGVFQSCKELEEHVCNRLLSVWEERRAHPSLIEQPRTQWADKKVRSCRFNGYAPVATPGIADSMTGNPVLFRRMLAASADDAHRSKVWANSQWIK